MSRKYPFYAVRVGRVPGVYMTSADAKRQVHGFRRGEMKGFHLYDEAMEHCTPGFQARKRAEEMEAIAKARDAERRRAAKAGLQEARSEAKKHEAELTRLSNELEATKKALVQSWSDVNRSASAHAAINENTGGDKVKVYYVFGSSAFSSLAAAQLFSEGKIVYKCYTDEEVRTAARLSGASIIVYNDNELYTGQNERGETVHKVYTDGSCLSNGTSTATAGVGVSFGQWHSWNVSERISGRQTNQRAELTAIKRALEVIDAKGEGRKFQIHTDSAYAIGCLTEWNHDWRRRGWITSAGTPVQNKDLIRELLDLKERPSCRHITFHKVESHRDNFYNDDADRLAKMGARKNEVGEKKYCNCDYCVRSPYLLTTNYSCGRSKGGRSVDMEVPN